MFSLITFPRGFGYIEFKSIDAVKDAIEGMNGFDLGGQNLQVVYCIANIYINCKANYESLGGTLHNSTRYSHTI
jgi:RNA recognition motif-containing protein